MQSLCHLNLTPYTVFETNVVACHITAEHSSKSLDWWQILFPKSFSTPHDNQNGCSSEHWNYILQSVITTCLVNFNQLHWKKDPEKKSVFCTAC